MPKYTTKFDITLDDMKLIETALRAAIDNDGDESVDAHTANDLLGRLHNQKNFYRPAAGVYVGG
ncbi:MAG: hypothetical protein AAF479_08215 [Pseudomonadota bacterium]